MILARHVKGEIVAMEKIRKLYHRRSPRLAEYDYSNAGAYFVTICAHNRQCLFGEVVDGEMRCNRMGEMVKSAWEELPVNHSEVELGVFCVMPNHVHGILRIADSSAPVGAIHESPMSSDQRRKMLLPKLVGKLKMTSAKEINLLRNMAGVPVWQRNYYEHVIRDEAEFNRICQYIEDNPLQWAFDCENPVIGAIHELPLQKEEPWRI